MYIQKYDCIDASCRNAGVLFSCAHRSQISCETVLTTQCRLSARGHANPLAGNPGKVFRYRFECRFWDIAPGAISVADQCPNHFRRRLLTGGVFLEQREQRLVSSADPDSSKPRRLGFGDVFFSDAVMVCKIKG